MKIKSAQWRLKEDTASTEKSREKKPNKPLNEYRKKASVALIAWWEGEFGDAVEAMSLGHIVEGFGGEGCQKNLALKSRKMLKGFNRFDVYVLNFQSGFTVENTKSKDSQ